MLTSDGLFHRILTRAIRWSQECGGHEPQLYYRRAKFYLDDEHDYVLEMSPLHFARISVSLILICLFEGKGKRLWLLLIKLKEGQGHRCYKLH